MRLDFYYAPVNLRGQPKWKVDVDIVLHLKAALRKTQDAVEEVVCPRKVIFYLRKSVSRIQMHIQGFWN